MIIFCVCHAMTKIWEALSYLIYFFFPHLQNFICAHSDHFCPSFRKQKKVLKIVTSNTFTTKSNGNKILTFLDDFCLSWHLSINFLSLFPWHCFSWFSSYFSDYCFLISMDFFLAHLNVVVHISVNFSLGMVPVRVLISNIHVICLQNYNSRPDHS